jgi:SAM-dependent methyltransferase
MVLLHNLLIEVLPSEGAVLDIGFGSGRDLEFLYQNGFEIWGIDPTASFVLHVKQRFTPIADHFYQDRLPFTTFQSPVHFDGVLAIAFWMHLGYEEYAAAVRDIVRICKPQATVVISYSEGSRGNDDGRLFYEVDQERLVGLFVQEGFALNVTHQNADALARSSLQWKTIVFKR